MLPSLTQLLFATRENTVITGLGPLWGKRTRSQRSVNTCPSRVEQYLCKWQWLERARGLSFSVCRKRSSGHSSPLAPSPQIIAENTGLAAGEYGIARFHCNLINRNYLPNTREKKAQQRWWLKPTEKKTTIFIQILRRISFRGLQVSTTNRITLNLPF